MLELKFCQKPSKPVHYCTSLYLNVAFYQLFSLNIVIRPKCQEGTDCLGGHVPPNFRAYVVCIKITGFRVMKEGYKHMLKQAH